MASTVLPNGIIVPEKFSRDWYADLYHNWQELDNLLAGGGANDGALTIQKNGTTVGTFSANQATDETVNIEVPTKTSDLNNDSGFITGVSWNDVSDKPTFATVATSGSYDDLNNKPTIPTVNDATLTIQKNGTTVDTFTANSSTDKTVNIQCVDLTNNQTVGGIKTFSNSINNKGAQQFIFNKEYSDATDNWLNIHNYLDKNDIRMGFYAIGDFSGDRGFRWFVRGQSTNSVETDIFGFGRKGDETSYMYINATLETDLIPTYNNSKSLGTSTNKWKTFNGINPGALSLPSGTVGMNVIGDVSVVSTEKKLSKDITITGFVYVDVSFTSSNRLNLYNDTKKYGIWLPCDSGRIRQIMPISAGDRLEFNVLDAGSTINAIQIFTCQGNV